MHIFIAKNNPYYDDLSRNQNQNLYSKKLESLEIELKKKYEKVQDFNPEECYNYSENSDEESLSIDDSYYSPSQMEDNQRNSVIPGSSNKTKSQTFFSHINVPRRTHVTDKIIFYKKLINAFDVISAILIILGAIISQVEHETYYYDNIHKRVASIVIINNIYNYPGHNSWEQIFNDNNTNLTEIMDFTDEKYDSLTLGIEVKSVFTNYVNNTRIYTNLEIMDALSLKASLFNYVTNATDYGSITIPLEIFNTNKNLRLILLIMTLASIMLLFFSRYIEHMREYIYKKEQESKIIN